MNLNTRQILSILGVILGVAMASTAQLTELLGPGPAKAIVSVAGMLSSTLNGILAVLSGQANTVKEVAAMPGVEGITVNDKANQVLAAVAIDPRQEKVAPIPEQEKLITEIAEQ